MQWREPVQITQGDTVNFKRKLGNYLATDGWSLLYALRGNGQDIEFTSTADGSDHKILVQPAITELWLAAEYVLEGWAVNINGNSTLGIDAGARYQIYLGSLTITPDLSAAAPDIDVTTHAQRMLSSIEAQLEQIAQNVLSDTTVEGTRILREKRNDLLLMRNRYVQERRGEIAAQRARNKLPSQRKIKTVLAVTPPGNESAATFGAGNSVFNYFNP